MRLAGIVRGLGLGGFVDGITLHQIMQWHNMGSAVLPPTTMDAMAQNMVWDELFHAATLVLAPSDQTSARAHDQRGDGWMAVRGHHLVSYGSRVGSDRTTQCAA